MNSRRRGHGSHPCRLAANARAGANPAWAWVFCGSVLFGSAGTWAQSASGAAHQHAHVHGVAKLGIAVQGETVSISLESPLDSLIGFEHRPNTRAEQTATAALQRRMRAPLDLFVFNTEAACTFVKADAQSAIFEPAPAGESDAHADLDASFEYRCAQPGRLTTVDVGLFKAYGKLKKVEAEVATDHGQFRRTLTSAAHVVALVR